MAEPRYLTVDGVTICEDCGVPVAITDAHTRHHSILNSHAWALAVLENAHIAAHVHDRYNVKDRIRSKTFDSWSGEAFAEVVAQMDGEPDGTAG